MSNNPFKDWTAKDVAAHNARVLMAGRYVPLKPDNITPDLASQMLDPSPGFMTVVPPFESPGYAFRVEDYRQEKRVFVIKIKPMGAVRLNHSCRWKRPPNVVRYFAYRDQLKAELGANLPIPDELDIDAFIAMPASWSEKKKKQLEGFPCRSKPDYDNLSKAVVDSLFKEDQRIWSGRCRKFWARTGQLKVTMIYWRKKI